MSTSYVVEYARSGRAGCKGTCKKPIEQGHLRFGSVSDRDGFSSTYWRHFPECMTATVARNALKVIGSPGNLSGLSELKPEDKSSVMSFLESVTSDSAPAEKSAKKARISKENADVTAALVEDTDQPESKKPAAKSKKASPSVDGAKTTPKAKKALEKGKSDESSASKKGRKTPDRKNTEEAPASTKTKKAKDAGTKAENTKTTKKASKSPVKSTDKNSSTEPPKKRGRPAKKTSTKSDN